MAELEKALVSAGAAQSEILSIERLLAGESEADFSQVAQFVRTNPALAMRVLRAEVRADDVPPPLPIYPFAKPVVSCDELLGSSIPSGKINSATVAASDGSCRVVATVSHPPSSNPVTIFIALPVNNWNGRFMGTGGGGYAGGFASSLDAPSRKGWAVGATDTGNPAGTANFAIGGRGKPAWARMRENAYLGIHDMTIVGKALVTRFYGRGPRYSYFMGISTGGRQAITETRRYPNDYDGLVAISPSIARDRYVPAMIWPQVLMNEAHDFLTKKKRDAATAAAVKACGVNGVIDDPIACGYDPAALIGSKIGGSVFTATDARIIRGIWRGPRTRDDRFLWWGPTRGTDLTNFADTEGSPPTGKPCPEGLDWFRYFLMRDPKWDWKTLTRSRFERLLRQSVRQYASMYGGDDPDLSGFRRHGGKLLIIHGLADQFVPPQKTINYYHAVSRRLGGNRRIKSFVRLFLVPGADHGYATPVPVPNMAEALGQLIAWVEHDVPPAALSAEEYDSQGRLVQTRALSSYSGSELMDHKGHFVHPFIPAAPTRGRGARR
jgi:pimeloyl-ACP methyl ester carboxylesterase